MEELPSFIQKDIRDDIRDIYDKLNHLKELLTKNENCHCCILELIRCRTCNDIICPNCDEKKCQICKKFICKNCLNYKIKETDPNVNTLSWFACNSCKNIELYNGRN